ncbi:MAG TPA: ATP-binding protein [Blastocatellia bacterium]|nr:ATP-binding protein [Blastocatellia bacterium]
MKGYSVALLLAMLSMLLLWPGQVKAIFSSGFAPHGTCYYWNTKLIVLHVSSDLVIGTAYVIISALLVKLVYRARRDIPFTWIFVAFGLFIVACGATHFMEIWTVWYSNYWLSGYVKLLTALASIGTAIALWPLIPKALELIRTAKLSDERKAQLEAAHTELADLYEKLKELDQLKTQFFANVSHELRTPLALILGPTERLLNETELSEQQRHELQVVTRNARTLLKHVNDLLDVSKLEAGKMHMHYVEADLARLLKLTASHFESLAQERKIDLAIEAPDSLPAQVDAEKIQRVFLNLLSNAFKFTPNEGVVRCVMRSNSNQASIEFHDSGLGVRPELRAVIFERFRQADGSTTRSFGGTGLGLSITKEFVELHDGSISVGDSPEGGALFVVRISLVAPPDVAVQPALIESDNSKNEAAEQALAELRSHVEAVASEQQLDQPLVLVVEDHQEMNRFIVETLESNYRVVNAFDGRSGLQQAIRLKPDLILSDVMMPGMSGDQLLKAVRERPELDSVPFVMLTAKADDDLRIKSLREGAQDYLMKPFSIEELRARVGNLITLKRAREILQLELNSQLSDLEQLSKEVSFHKRELQSSLEATRAAREQAESASRAKSDFLRLVTHELRTPLTAITGYLDVLRRSSSISLSDRQAQLLQKITRSSDRLKDLIESLLEYARIESGRLMVNIEPFDLIDVLSDLIDEVKPQAEMKGIAMDLQAEPNVPLLESDVRLIRLILINIVGNAVKFTNQGGVNVSISYGNERHSVIVRDTGPGIQPEYQKMIFEPFSQIDPIYKKHKPGFGLGLALVKQMIDALGGEIELHSEPGVGTTFTVHLPPASVKELKKLSLMSE